MNITTELSEAFSGGSIAGFNIRKIAQGIMILITFILVVIMYIKFDTHSWLAKTHYDINKKWCYLGSADHVFTIYVTNGKEPGDVDAIYGVKDFEGKWTPLSSINGSVDKQSFANMKFIPLKINNNPVRNKYALITLDNGEPVGREIIRVQSDCISLTNGTVVFTSYSIKN